MKMVRSLILLLMLFVSVSSSSMECELCFKSISVDRPSISMCSNKACAQSHQTCKKCWLEYAKPNQLCHYGCGSKLDEIDYVNDINRSHMSKCVACNKSFIKNGKPLIGVIKFYILECSHFVCSACSKNTNEYKCPHDACKKFNTVTLDNKNYLQACNVLKNYNVKKEKRTKPVKPIAPAKPIADENCPLCHQDKRIEDFRSIGCAVDHRYCIHCLPAILTHYHNCPACDQHITNKDRIRLTDEIARHRGDSLLPSQKDFVRIGGLVGLSAVVLPWVAHYWSKYRLQSILNSINHAAITKTNTLLNFEFDGDNDVAFLTLQESFDMVRILNEVKSAKEYCALRTAIEQYDSALRKVYDSIVSTYYYQPVAYFEQKEPQLVQELKACTEQINQLITEYTQELGSPLRTMLLGAGFGALCGIGVLQITGS